MNKHDGTIDRETALKLVAAGGLGALLPLLTAMAGAKPTKSGPGVGGSPMNLSFAVPGSTAAAMAKGKRTLAYPPGTPGTVTIQMWDATQPPPPAAPGVLVFSFDGSGITPKGAFDDTCKFKGKAKNGALHIRIYFAPT